VPARHGIGTDTTRSPSNAGSTYGCPYYHLQRVQHRTACHVQAHAKSALATRGQRAADLEVALVYGEPVANDALADGITHAARDNSAPHP